MNTKAAFQRWCAEASTERKPATRQFYAAALAILEADWPRDCPVAEITSEDVQAFAQAAGRHSASMWNTLVSAIRKTTPAGHFLKRRPMKIRPTPPPTQAEFDALLAECDKSPKSKAGTVIRFLALTGLRISEARALEWRDIRDDCLIVRESKNGCPRSVPLVAGFHTVAEQLRAMGNGPLVLPRPSIRKGLRNACRRAGGPLVTHHTLRHLFATRCIESGVDIPTVARWLGHRDGGALLARTYFHLQTQHSREMAGKVKIRV